MDYAQVEEQFQLLKQQFTAGTLDEAAFKAKLNELMVQDAQGRWWMIGYETGQWYTHDGKAWVRADPPGRAQHPPAQQATANPVAAQAKPVVEARPNGPGPGAPAAPAGEKSTSATPPANVLKKMGWDFWLGWLVSIGAGIGIFALIISNYHSSESVIWAFVLGAAAIGFGQWLVMRQYIRYSGWWIPGSLIYSVVTFAIGDSGDYSTAYFLLMVFGILDLIVLPVIVSRRRRSS